MQKLAHRQTDPKCTKQRKIGFPPISIQQQACMTKQQKLLGSNKYSLLISTLQTFFLNFVLLSENFD